MKTTTKSVADGRTPLGRLCQYANFERLHDAPPVVATMDHRVVVAVAWAAMRQGILDAANPPLLVRFDAHPDMGERPLAWADEKARMTDLDSVLAACNAHRHDDGGWAVAAMQLGLCGDMATFFLHDYHRFPGDDGEYEDHEGSSHRMHAFASVREMLDRGATRARALQDAMVTRSLWIDIDLDFATRRAVDDSVRAWSDDDWRAEFGARELAWLGDALARASLVTIALEPWFCGGVEACGKIAGRLRTLHPLFAKL